MNKTKLAVQDYLLKVNKPARYIGQEFNASTKELKKSSINCVLCFPDVYEVGMSHLGIKILYHILNKQEDVCCQRCFAPWIDMEKIMRQEKIELFSLESQRPIKDFDIIGFSLQYELGFTNVLNMLELAGLPLLAKERVGLPLVIAGGPCCFNPEPMAEFFDLFVIGEAEDVILEIINVFRQFKKEFLIINNKNTQQTRLEKDKLLRQLATLDGVYVSSLYEVQKENGKFSDLKPKFEDVPVRIKKRYIENFNSADYPTKPPVPFIEVIHDRISLEIMRGCPHECRFCQAGFTLKPMRIRSIDSLMQLAKKTHYNTGYENISFCGLSCADYPYLKELISGMQEFCQQRGIGISLPSLRIDKNFLGMPALIAELKKTGLTFAPEAGSERLRRLINKNINIEKLKQAAQEAFQAGWRRLKLYFMIGLPKEEEQDLIEIINLVNEFSVIRKSIDGRSARISVSISNFIPKPHTPFQWLGMQKKEELFAKQKFLESRINKKNLEIHFHNINMSFLESFLSRADRDIYKVIMSAFKKGARFEAWSNMFNFNIWQEAFLENKINAEEYVYKRYDLNSKLPWEHIDCGASIQFLKKELNAAI